MNVEWLNIANNAKILQKTPWSVGLIAENNTSRRTYFVGHKELLRFTYPVYFGFGTQFRRHIVVLITRLTPKTWHLKGLKNSK